MKTVRPTRKRRGVFLPALLLALLFSALFTQKQHASASVTVTEFSDFQCPYCKRAASVVEQVRRSYGDRVNVVFKQMPLPMHQHAFKAAQASVCAREQGKFWEYHDHLFAANDLAISSLNQIATDAGLNVSEFKQCLASEKSKAEVESDVAEAERLGVSGTPTFFVNGKMVKGEATFATLNREIDAATPRTMAGSLSKPDALSAAKSSGSDRRVRPQVSVPENSSSGATVLTTLLRKDQMQASSTTTASGVTLHPANINFGYQLVASMGAQIVETVTNSSTAALVITDISVSGRDRGDFVPTYSFTLPVTVSPGQSLTINLTFTPGLPWRAGSRNARLEIAEKKHSQFVPLTGIGATCGGPLPACSSGCADADGDGLNDAWETAEGIDFDNDGSVDFRFPHADFTPVNQTGDGTGMVLPGRTNQATGVTTSSIVVTIDTGGQVGAATFSYSLGAGTPVGPLNTAPAVDIPGNVRLGFANGQVNPSFVAGATYSFSSGDFKVADKDRPNIYLQYDYMDWSDTPSHTCTQDSDCVGGGGELFGERCHLGRCNHNHDPDAAAPGAISKVVGAYAAHGITLYIDPIHQALPHHRVISWRDPEVACEGSDGVNFFTLKSSFFDPRRQLIFHYAIFGHYSGCEFDALGTHCGQCPDSGPPGRAGQPLPGQSGMAELPGNDFIVSLGNYSNDQNHPANLFNVGGTFMHEFGHNFGLRHAGDGDTPTYKPNYLSVMNYNFQLTGIAATDAPPADPVVGVLPIELNQARTRLDYSEETVATLDEVFDGVNHFGLNELAGAACGGPDALSVFQYTDDNNDSALGSCTGPVNWDMNTDATGMSLQVDLNQPDHSGSVVYTQLTGHSDWGSTFIAALPFQCTEWGSADGAAPFESLTTGELTPEIAARHHVLYLPRTVDIEITPGCPDKMITPGRRGEFSVALLGSEDLDVGTVEPLSLRFHGAVAVRTEMSDVNGDGKLDLLVFFDQASVRLDSQAKTARLTGWLKSSQLFIGGDRIEVLP